MLTRLLVAASLAVANAMPRHQHQHHERNVDYVYETATDVVYVTDYATVTAGDQQPAPSPQPVVAHHENDAANNQQHAPHWDPPASVTSTSTTLPSPTTTSTTPAAETSSAQPPPPPPPPTNTGTSSQQDSSSQDSAIPKPTDYKSYVTAHHNLHRRNHSASDLQWDDGLASAANTLASQCDYHHEVGIDKDTLGVYGQNIALGYAAANISGVISDLFYNGEVSEFAGQYHKAQPDGNFEAYGHFSQVVWKDTSKVGCATVYCPGGVAHTPVDPSTGKPMNIPPYSVVCNYASAGNYPNEWAKNVGDSLKQETKNFNYFGQIPDSL